jgi:hypothetical protein
VGRSSAVANSTSLNLSWRYLALEWNDGSRDQHGIEAGVKIFF